ncbi:M23 family metallopeptidase [Deltaproteobacteria bacterium]|nr:M23 family metallopeptidase [Deltaproteobacteria bacterium]
MKSYSIILLKDSSKGVHQYHLGGKFIFFMLLLVLTGAASLSWIYFDQYLKIANQRQLLEKQELAKSAYQKQIDLYDGRESRITFLEDYVEELKQSAHNSKLMFKKHSALFSSNIKKLDEMHNYICQTLEPECSTKLSHQLNTQQTVKWMDMVYQDFVLFNQNLQEYASQRKGFEEQENTIHQLRRKLVETEQELSEHMEFLKVNQETVNRLTQKITKTTGISLSKVQKSKQAKAKTGRGGPTILDSMSLDSPQELLSPGVLRQFLYRSSDDYFEKVSQLEDLSLLIDRNHNFWRHTPTIIPLRSRALSDRYGVRKDPFTKKKAFHGGLDFKAKRGSPVYAPSDGIVKTASRKYGFGLLVELQHGRGFFPGKKKTVRYRTRFAHLSKINVRRGQKIKRGELIGLVGSTGRSTGPHLHYEIIINGRRTNPLITISKFNPDQRLYLR